MATVTESAGAKTPMGSDLAAGLDTLSLDQQITFTLYVRLVLPLDGYVFWVKAELLTPSALANALRPNVVTPNQAPTLARAAKTLVVKGSLHYGTDSRQEQEENYSANRMIFTAEDEVNDLDNVTPGTMWIGRDPAILNGRRFAFSSQTSRYEQAGLWHYVGFAVYPDMETQIIDDLAGFDSTNVVVSNSLPAWLALNGYVPLYGFGNPSLPLFPSFLVPANLVPPFAAVHIAPESTKALAAAPRLSRNSSHSQLCSDVVKITLWGTRNFDAMDFLDCVNQYSLDVGTIGIMNMPVPRDEKRTQNELNTIAMKKSIEFEVSYLQGRMNDVARQTIQDAIVNFYPEPLSV